MKLPFTAIAITLLLTGCVDFRGGDGPLIVARLYLGQSNAAGAIPPQQFDEFIDTVVTPKFPDGLTLIPANGRWRAPDNTLVRERTIVLELIYPDNETGRTNVLAVIEQYKQRFRQHAVLLVVEHPSVSYR